MAIFVQLEACGKVSTVSLNCEAILLNFSCTLFAKNERTIQDYISSMFDFKNDINKLRY